MKGSSAKEASAPHLTKNLPGPRGLLAISGLGPGAGPHQLLGFHLVISGAAEPGKAGGDPAPGAAHPWGCPARLHLPHLPCSLGSIWRNRVQWIQTSVPSPTSSLDETGPGLSLSFPIC